VTPKPETRTGSTGQTGNQTGEDGGEWQGRGSQAIAIFEPSAFGASVGCLLDRMPVEGEGSAPLLSAPGDLFRIWRRPGLRCTQAIPQSSGEMQ